MSAPQLTPPFRHDSVDIVCPLYDKGRTREGEEVERFAIYLVGRDEYDTCRVDGKNPRMVAMCDEPYR